MPALVPEGEGVCKREIEATDPTAQALSFSLGCSARIVLSRTCVSTGTGPDVAAPKPARGVTGAETTSAWSLLPVY